jgi:hypothetical protein
VRYVAAFNAGRVTDLDEYFAPVPRFMVYGVLPPAGRWGDRARDRAGLLDYLRRRQARHERIELTWIEVTGDPVTDDIGNFALRGRRTADDLPGRQRLLGKGAIDCDTHKLIAVGIGRP